MHSKLITRQFAIWLACFAILMNALAPSISHAMANPGSGPASWEICRAANAASPVKKSAPLQAAAMQDCGYCLPHAGSYALMPTVAAGLGLFGGHTLRPFLFYRAPQPLLALSAAPPRGPPAIS
jgi:hypothetical protein